MSALSDANRQCEKKGVRLTEKRQWILEALIAHKAPMSAYDLSQAISEQHDQRLQPMSVYRMLDSLIEAGLVHKLHSSGQFIACSHMPCAHPHHHLCLLICDVCQSVSELTFKPALEEQFRAFLGESGFAMGSLPIEINGRCQSCQGAQ